MLHIKNCLDFFYNHLDDLLGNHEIEKLADCDTKGTFTQIQLYLLSTKDIEDFFQVFDVISFLKALNKHIVDINLHAPKQYNP